MPAIEKLKIKGFKAFPNEFELNLEGKHLLLYGENGSGKSSIYYALHCLFQAPFKQDSGKKYFDSQNPQNLINKDSHGEESFIELIFMPPHPWCYKVDKDGYNTELLGGVKPIPGDLYNNIFINHKFISNIASCRNSEDIDLFPVFYKDIFPYILVRSRKQILGNIYETIINNPSRRKEYQKSIEYLNQETKYWIDSMNLNISNIYNDSFRNKEDNKLRIQLIFKDTPETINNELIYYWGRYDYRTYKEIVANNPVIKKAHYKSFIEPHIGLKIEEILCDGSSRQIDKPQTYFNEAKLTAIALAVRFSTLDIVSDANGQFMALDDMLISLDMSNRSKMVDFLLSKSDKYKIYLFTHDKAFYDYICRAIKLSGNQSEWIYKSISYCPSKNTPILLDNYGDYISKAKHFYDIGDYETSAIYTRKELEQSVGDLLPYELKVKADGGFVNLETLWKKLVKFYSDNGTALDKSMKKLFDNSKLLILNVAAHYQRLSFPIYKIELDQVFSLIEYIHSLKKIEKKLIIPANKTIKFIHPSGNYYCSFELETDLVVEIGDHIVYVLPKCQNIFWKYNDIDYYNFETGIEDRANPLITARPKLANFILNMPKEIKVSEDDFISNCSIEGNRLDDYLCGIKFSKMVKA